MAGPVPRPEPELPPHLPPHLRGVLDPQQGPPTATSNSDLLIPGPFSAPGGGYFWVSFDQAPQTISNLYHAAWVLDQKRRKAEQLARYPSPGLDEVSNDAVVQIGKAATGEQGSVTVAFDAAARKFEDLAKSMEATLKTYHQTEQLNLPPPDPLEP